MFSLNRFEVFAAIFLNGLGYGNAPAIFAQISVEAGAEDQGRAQGFVGYAYHLYPNP